jgi:hypothetical protein
MCGLLRTEIKLFCFIKFGEFIDYLNDFQLLDKDFAHLSQLLLFCSGSTVAVVVAAAVVIATIIAVC